MTANMSPFYNNRLISTIVQFDCVVPKHGASVVRCRLLSLTLRVNLGSILLVLVTRVKTENLHR